MSSIWLCDSWPELTWDAAKLLPLLMRVSRAQGRLLGKMEGLGFEEFKQEAHLNAMTDDVDGIVGLVIDATTNYALPLTRRRLFSWHESLFPTGKSGLANITTGQFRDGPMQVVSGAIGKEKVHYEAPPADGITEEMAQFPGCFEEPDADTDPLLVAGLAHFRFVTIHPFDDGNGRIARAIESADATVDTVLQKARFRQRFAEAPLNERQTRMLNRLLDGFEGKLTAAEWARMTRSSHDTALRDIKDLIERGALIQEEGGGRSTRYALVLDN